MDPSFAFHYEKDPGYAGDLWKQESVTQDMTRVMYSPFVLSLASGELETKIFHNFSAQEVTCLKAYAELYELAEKHVSDTNAKTEFQRLRNSVLQQLELKHYPSQCSDEATSHYIDFLWDTADVAVTEMGMTTYILASILPSFKTYQYIAQELNKFAGSRHPYHVWVSDHSSQHFDASIAQMENFHNHLIITPTEKQVRTQYTIYQRAMELVLEMFYGLNFTKPTLVPLIQCHPDLILFSGFEFCCTEDDWCSTFFYPVSCSLESPILITASQQLSELYEQGIKIITPIVSSAFSYMNLQQGLQQLSTFEKDATNNLIESGLLKGLSKECVEHFGKCLVFESTDCLDLFSRLGKSANVISSSWCGGNILKEAFESGFSELEEVELHANKLCFEQSTCTGAFEKKVQSAMEKLAIFQEKIDKNGGLTIYIGDSVNDLLCMIKASIGIAVRPSSSLQTVGTQFGIAFVPLFSDLVEKLRQRREGSHSLWQPESGVVYTVSSWTELHSFIFGADEKESNAAFQFLPPKRSSKTLEEPKNEKKQVCAKVGALFKQLADASSKKFDDFAPVILPQEKKKKSFLEIDGHDVKRKVSEQDLSNRGHEQEKPFLPPKNEKDDDAESSDDDEG